MWREHLRIDWRVLLFALFGCYFLPWLAWGVVLSNFVGWDEQDHGSVIGGWVWLGYFLLMPVLSGYFTARFARNRPQLHVAVVAVLGPLFLLALATSSKSGSNWFVVVYMMVMALCCTFGAFVAFRTHARK